MDIRHFGTNIEFGIQNGVYFIFHEVKVSIVHFVRIVAHAGNKAVFMESVFQAFEIGTSITITDDIHVLIAEVFPFGTVQ